MKNFLSFYSETFFDMFPNPKRERFQGHIYHEGYKVPVLKQAAVYGANAAGKSNLVKAFSFLQGFVTNPNFHNVVEFEDYRFQLVEDSKEPMSLTVEFFEKKYYIYQVEVNGAVSERLWVSSLGEGENELVFERIGSRVTGEVVGNPQSSQALLSKNARSSVLSLNVQFPILSGEDVQNVTNWFRDRLVVATINTKINTLIELLEQNKPLMEFACKMLCELKITDRLEIAETDFNDWLSTKNGRQYKRMMVGDPFKDAGISSLYASKDMRNEFRIVKKNGVQVVQEFLFRQTGVGGYEKGMDIDSQSDGTVRLLTLIPLIYDAIYNGKVVVIDEVENSMHPTLIFNLIRFFGESRSNGQLLFTTHLSKLMDQQELMRLDELWLVEKTGGDSTMRCMNDFKIHNTINIEHGYLEGRYGGVPEIGALDNE